MTDDGGVPIETERGGYRAKWVVACDVRSSSARQFLGSAEKEVFA